MLQVLHVESWWWLAGTGICQAGRLSGHLVLFPTSVVAQLCESSMERKKKKMVVSEHLQNVAILASRYLPFSLENACVSTVRCLGSHCSVITVLSLG